VTLISLGFLTNLAALLESPPDSASPLSGRTLVATKVRELVVMGGRYPQGGWEYNFAGVDPNSTRAVVNGWPRAVPLTFVGYELGKPIMSGGQLPELASRDSPVLAAYQWYVGRCKTARESWDPLAVLYGVVSLGDLPAFLKAEGSGQGPLFIYANKGGRNSISEDGTNTWVDDAGVTNQHWLQIGRGWGNISVAELIDQLLASGPGDGNKTHNERDEL